MAALSVTNVATKDQPRAIASLVLAFSADPFNRWIFPEPRDYLANFPDVVKHYAGRAFEHETAYCVNDFCGTALWLPPGVHPDEEALGQMIEDTVESGRKEKLFGVLQEMDSYHPAGPFWYLPLIGVEPSQQGHGYGSALMAHALRQCDREGLPAYLESSNQRNISLYERHGFDVIGKIQVEDSPDSPIIRPMLRAPRS